MFCCTAAVSACLLGVIPAGTAHAEDTTISGGIGTIASSSSTIELPIPAGVAPSQLRGILTITEAAEGSIDFLINGRVIKTVPAQPYQVVNLPLRPNDVGDGDLLNLTMSYEVPESDNDCAAADGSSASFRKIGLTYSGTETIARTLGTFFPPSASRIDVVIPARANDDVIAAGLTAVASLAAVYPEGTPVMMATADAVLPRAGASQRVVRIESGDGATQTRIDSKFGLQTLTLTGSGQELKDAAQALGSPQLQLADAPGTQGLAETLEAQDIPTDQTLEELGTDRVQLSGYGSSTAFVGIRQDSFGGPVSEIDLDIIGTHSAVPEGNQAQLDTHFNGFLIDSQILDDTTALEIKATVPETLIKADNGLEFTLHAVPANGDCSTATTKLPIEVFIDGGLSDVNATRGAGTTTGFEVYPQVLGGQLPVAIRTTGVARTQSAIDAAYLVAALQQAAAAPLEVELVDVDSFLGGDRSGLLIGADYPDSVTIDAPLRLSGMRLIDYAEAQFQVGSNQPFAALETVSNNGRNVLMLGAWAPNAETDVAALMRKAVARVGTTGWGELLNDVLVANPTSPVFTLSSNAFVPQLDRAEERKSFGWWFIIGIGVLLLLLALQVTRTLRRDRRIKAVVSAQEEADAQDDPGADPEADPWADKETGSGTKTTSTTGSDKPDDAHPKP